MVTRFFIKLPYFKPPKSFITLASYEQTPQIERPKLFISYSSLFESGRISTFSYHLSLHPSISFTISTISLFNSFQQWSNRAGLSRKCFSKRFRSFRSGFETLPNDEFRTNVDFDIKNGICSSGSDMIRCFVSSKNSLNRAN